MTRSRAERHMNTLPLRLNGTEFLGRPVGSLLVTRVDGRPGDAGDWSLYITLRRPPAKAGMAGLAPHPTAYFPVPAPDLVYVFPDDDTVNS
jgi:hypothetical protein